MLTREHPWYAAAQAEAARIAQCIDAEIVAQYKPVLLRIVKDMDGMLPL